MEAMAMAPDEMDQDHVENSGREAKGIRELKEEIKERREEIKEKEKEIKGKENEIRELKEDIRRVQNEIANAEVREPLEAELQVLRQEISSLRQVISSLRQVTISLQQEISSLHQQISNLQQKISSLAPVQKARASAEGEPPSKKAKRPPDEYKSLDEQLEFNLTSKCNYFKKLLEPPVKLPESVKDLQEFLSQRTVQLPLLDEEIYLSVGNHKVVKIATSREEMQFACFCDSALKMMRSPIPDNEATSSYELATLTGRFISDLNGGAHEKLKNLTWMLDSPNLTTSESTSQPLRRLLRPDFLLYVKNVLVLRWENTMQQADLVEAMYENAHKLKVWSPLYYGVLPYVLGGCCAGRQFHWLKLSLRGKEIVPEIISDVYDLNLSSDVALFLHSTIRMHCLLQKLQGYLTDPIRVILYRPLRRSGGGEIVIYPDLVSKVVVPPLDNKKFQSMYASIAGSRYLIQLLSIRTTSKRTTMLLEPVGDPHARPLDMKDLENATHDMLHGLADLHKQGYTHRDLRWANCIKVNVEGEWKWVIIDLEAAGPDKEEWVGDGLLSWDAGTLEDRNGKKIYTKGSDMYQLGKLIVEKLDFCGRGGEEEQSMRAWGEKMQWERGAATEMLEDICKNGCKRCEKFDRNVKTGFLS